VHRPAIARRTGVFGAPQRAVYCVGHRMNKPNRRTNGNRVAGREPHELSWLYKAGFIAVLVITVCIFVLGYGTKDPELGDFLKTILVPIFGLLSGGWIADYYHRRDVNKNIERDVGNAVYSASGLLQGVYHVDRRLAEASNALNEGDVPAALRAVGQAIARTDGNLLHVMQAIREWRELSRAAADEGKTDFEADLEAIRGRRQEIEIEDDQNSQGQGSGDA
jgi:hypothetical protein